MPTKSYYVYIIKCSDNSLYTGITNDLKNRIKIHNQGKGAKYTRGRLPVKLVYKKRYNSKSKALSKEFEIKKMSREEKEKLIKQHKPKNPR